MTAGVVLAALLAMPSAAGAARVEGVVLDAGGRPARAEVCVWPGLDLARDRASVCAVTAADGTYGLETDAARGIVAARDGDDGAPAFAFAGSNPVDFSQGYRWVPLLLTRTRPPSCRRTGESGVSGTVTMAGAPVAGAVVSAYAFGSGRFRGMGMQSVSTGEDGRFRLDLEPGAYTVVARKRALGGMGPIAAGDLFCYPAANPLRLPAGGTCEVEIGCYPRDDLDRYLGPNGRDPRGRRFAERRKASPAGFVPAGEAGAARRAAAVVHGRVTTVAGRPAAGMLVSAYPARGQDLFQMYLLRTMPLGMARSDGQGRYRLRLPGGGRYYLQARQETGEAPRRGEMYGLYCGNANHSLTLAAGEDRGAGITVARIMPPAGATKADGDGPAGTVHGLLRSQMIRRDTVWSGEVTVDGVIVVAPGARLTITPGTTVRFAWRDRNRDGIGDGEIRVLGEIRAEGTGERPVRFMAARPENGGRRWSYLMLYASSGRNVIRGCRFSGAFSGVQVHFSTAVIEDCVFSGNHEGLRFGRADITVRGNRFTGNGTGVRFTRMEGPAAIVGNLVSGNDVGVFLAPSGQNTTDFFDPERSGRPWNTGRLTIRGNTIAANREYDVKLGAKQMWDLDARGNRWTLGTDGGEPRIFDHGRDPRLGRVIRRAEDREKTRREVTDG